jgi:response regulator RpfG family c-di-GMP phosphodiesterase
MRYKILLVDDEPTNLRTLERLFRDEHEVIAAESGSEGIDLLGHHDIALIISDQRMPGMTGIDFLTRAAQIRRHTTRIILTGYTDVEDLVKAINSGVVYRYITKPWINTDLMQTVRSGLEHYEISRNRHLLATENERLKTRVEATVQGFVDGMKDVVSQKHPDVQEHCRRTARYATLIANRIGLDLADVEQLNFACLLHEVPNMRMAFDMGITRGALNPAQFDVVRRNYEFGVRIISRVPDLEYAASIIRHQHERFDGSGLFDGLAGDKIPRSARILALANALDEITSGRFAKPLCTDETAAKWIRDRAERDFDPKLVEVAISTCLGRSRDSVGVQSTGKALNGFALVKELR